MDSSRARVASCSSSKRWLYDVFLSFRGEDTRKRFTSHLEVALGEAGISAFIDKDLTRGENITDELNLKIESSRIAVVVFSKRYADSRWCLDELANIMDCRRREGQIVLPIFYDVDPSDVRNQTGSFEEGFKKHEKRIHEAEDEDDKKLEEDKVKRWKKALKEAANVAGDHLTNTANGDEGEFIKKIVNEINGKLDNNRYLSVAEYPVGIDSRVQTISHYLDIVGVSNDVRIIGIWGMGGMGKTTIAKAIWNEFHHRFESKSFLSEVRSGKLVKLQNKLLTDILRRTSIKVHSVHEGITEIEKRLGGINKVLVIIDDIDHADQLNALAIKHDSYGPGSRIVVTTRDEHLLNMIKVNEKYAAQAMNKEEALELFSQHAFRNHCAINEYSKFAREIVDKCGGLPLALQVVGRSLFMRSTREWESALETLKNIPPKDVHEQLKISYDGLTEPAKSMFLDISCFFIGFFKESAMAILDGCNHFSLESEFRILRDRCLVDVDIEGYLVMHDLLRDMGREIVCAESRDYPEERSRLWRDEDITNVLRNGSGTKKIRGVMLDLSESHMPSFSTEGLRKMQRLKFLRLQGVEFTGDYDHLSKELRWLHWHGFPLEVMPEDLNLENLVAVDLSHSRIQVWKDSNVCLDKLKFLNLADSKNLTRTPDISKLPNLKSLILRGCTSLSEVQLQHSTVQLKSMFWLDLSMCGLADGSIPEDLGSLSSLKTLILSGNGFSRLPILSGLSKLIVLKLNSCINLQSIPDLPSSLMHLEANYCTALEIMPDFSKMSNMRKLHLKECHKLNDIEGLVGSESLYLEVVHMEGCTKLTASFKNSIIDGWFGSGQGGLFLSGNDIDIPGWCTYVFIFNEDDLGVREFKVPESIGCNTTALTVCIIYSSDDSQSFGYLRLLLANRTQRTQFSICPMDTIARTSHEDILWMGNILNNNLNLKGGDKVVVSPKFFGEAREDNNRFKVKKIGVEDAYVDEDPEDEIDSEPEPYSFPDDEAGPSHHSSDED